MAQTRRDTEEPRGPEILMNPNTWISTEEFIWLIFHEEDFRRELLRGVDPEIAEELLAKALFRAREFGLSNSQLRSYFSYVRRWIRGMASYE